MPELQIISTRHQQETEIPSQPGFLIWEIVRPTQNSVHQAPVLLVLFQSILAS